MNQMACDSLKKNNWHFCNYCFRERYRRYKDLYKKQLEHPASENIKNLMKDLEDQLDIANILMAREQAKLEVGETFHALLLCAS